RLATLLGMFLVAVLATTVRSVFEGHSTGFVLAYLGVRLILLVLYARARRHVPEARRLTTIFLAAFGTATGFWVVSLAFSAPGRYAFWGAALVLELGAPLFAWRQLPSAPIHPRHIPERFGLLTLIVLGESVLGVVLGIAHVPWGAGSGAAAVRLRLAAAGTALPLVPLRLSPLVVVLVRAGLLAAQVAYELAEHEGHVAPSAGPT